MDNNQNNNKNPKNNKQNWSIIIITTQVTVFLVLGLYSFMQKTTSKEISYSEFLKMLDDKKIEEVVFDCNSGGVPHQHCMDIMIARNKSKES